MNKFLPLLAAGIMVLAMATNADAARRFGGGMSFGRPAPAQMAPMQNKGIAAPSAQRPQAAPQQQKAAPAQGPAAQPKPASPLRGMLMGAAAALGIAALAHYLGIGEERATILMFALAALVILSVIRFFLARRRQPAPAPVTSGMEYRRSEPRAAAQQFQPAAFQGETRAGSVLDEFQNKAAASPASPSGFDESSFLEESKKNFVKLQDAWSTGNVLQLSDFCTDEVFTILTHQLRERHGEKLQIAVQALDAKLLGVMTEGNEYVAAIHFTGRLDVSGETREIEDVNEVWTLTKPVSGNGEGWLLAGIQQVEP